MLLGAFAGCAKQQTQSTVTPSPEASASTAPVAVYGYSKPVAPNTTSAGKAPNRRVELFLLNAK